MTPHIGKKCKEFVKSHHSKIHFYDDDGVRLYNPNKNIPKVVANLKCNWCGAVLKEYRVICPMCHNCQYCGFYSPALNQCLHCGNQAPDEIKIRVERVKVRDIKLKNHKKDDII
jgi:primosomal protein N'